MSAPAAATTEPEVTPVNLPERITFRHGGPCSARLLQPADESIRIYHLESARSKERKAARYEAAIAAARAEYEAQCALHALRATPRTSARSPAAVTRAAKRTAVRPRKTLPRTFTRANALPALLAFYRANGRPPTGREMGGQGAQYRNPAIPSSRSLIQWFGTVRRAMLRAGIPASALHPLSQRGRKPAPQSTRGAA